MSVGSRLRLLACATLLGLVQCGGTEERQPSATAGTSGAAGAGGSGRAGTPGTAGTGNPGPQGGGDGAGGASEVPASVCRAPTADSYEPRWAPPRALPGSCTTEQIAAKYQLCSVDSGLRNTAACRELDLDPANAVCFDCLFTAHGDTPSGPLIVFPDDRWLANVGGCIALLDGDASATGCGARTQAARICQFSVCEEACPASASDKDRNTCREDARTACNSYFEESACTSLPGYGRCRHTGFEYYFITLGDIFCGAGPGAEGGAGAGGAAEGGEGGAAGGF